MSSIDGLAIEAVAIILLVAGARWINRRPHAGAPPPPMGEPPDPYAIAWLRGGSTAVLQLAAYQLVRDGHLALARDPGEPPASPGRSPAPQLIRLPAAPPADALPAAARLLLQQAVAPCGRAQLAAIAPLLAPSFAATERSLLADGLLLSPAQRAAGWSTTLLAMGLVLALAFWQLSGAAAEQAGSVVGVALLTAIGLSALRLLTAPEPRLSPSGRAYLRRCADALAQAAASQRGAGRWRPAADRDADALDCVAPAPGLLEVALSGIAVLTGTAHAGLVALLEPSLVAPGHAAFPQDSA